MTARRQSHNTPGKSAKILSVDSLKQLLAHVECKRHGSRNVVIVLLSFKAGLRACEIAGLDWSMVCDSTSRIADALDISRSIAKKGSGRRIPCHPRLAAALKKLHLESGRPSYGPVCRSERGGHMSDKSIVNWFAAEYHELGLAGCSSHSGRRTMITMAARSLAKVGGSLRDVQELAGHKNLATTEGYIEGDRVIQRRLIGLL